MVSYKFLNEAAEIIENSKKPILLLIYNWSEFSIFIVYQNIDYETVFYPSTDIDFL